MQRPFNDTFRDIEHGHLMDELTDLQQQLVTAVSNTNKPGKITIELNYKPEGQGQLTIKATVKSKIPEPARGSSLFFMTPEGNLLREDPRQTKLPLRSVEDSKPAPTELRQAQ